MLSRGLEGGPSWAPSWDRWAASGVMLGAGTCCCRKPSLGRETCRGGNMEWGGVSQPTFLVTGGDPHRVLSLPALTKSSDWVDQFRVKFLGSVQVPYHKGNDVLCAAMQKVVSHPIPGRGSACSSWQQGRASVGKGRERVSHHHCSRVPGLCLSVSPPTRLPPRAASLCTLTHPPAASWRSACVGSRLP